MNKQGRAKLAKDTINNLIPHILASNARAKAGVESTGLLTYTPHQTPKSTPPTQQPPLPTDPAKETSNSPTTLTTSPISSQPLSPPQPKIQVIQSDTFDAAHSLLATVPKHSKCRIAVLNMASALRPGGGVLNGAVAQEESLCLRSTLYPSLHPSYYRLPALGALYSSDVLVFRDSKHVDLPQADWYFVDVISCAAVKSPDVVPGPGPDGKMVYGSESDRESMVLKCRLILQAAREKGVTHLVLGALGCGAYRNPPEEVARIFKKVILGDRKTDGVVGIEEIVFAIFDDGENLRVFGEVFGEGSAEKMGEASSGTAG